MIKLEQKNWRRWLPDLRDLLCVIGIAALFYGLYETYPPAAFIVVGSICLAGSIWGIR